MFGGFGGFETQRNQRDWGMYPTIISGAIGNLIDRVSRGAVFDFIFVHYHSFAFPVFNIADSNITIGAVIFACNHFFFKKSP